MLNSIYRISNVMSPILQVQYPFCPFFYVGTVPGMEREVVAYLRRKYSTTAKSIELEDKENLDMPNHLIGLKHSFIRISFDNIDDMQRAKQELNVFVNRNRQRSGGTHYQRFMQKQHHDARVGKQSALLPNIADQPEYIVELREYDVPYITRVAINRSLNVGCWYDVLIREQNITITQNKEIVSVLTHSVFAFDIETTKLPLKFPDSNIDEIMMISFMFDGVGYLINNREIISQDVENFEYTPRPEFPGHFTVYNEANEEALLRKFILLILQLRPLIFVTYNGDFFDWPFVDNRCSKYNINLKNEIGFFCNSDGEYKSSCPVHMDAIKWVRRDSYLPIGSQGLKAVTRNKLRYDPDEINPEDMCRYAVEKPQVLANYSVSDAVATYYLYMKYVHPFIFALTTVIPLNPTDVLCKGSGTLCEALLMSMAYNANVIFPNKQVDPIDQYTKDGHLLESETYVGATVEALESGVFRSDLKYKFNIDAEQVQQLIDNVDRIFELAAESEGFNLEDVVDLVEMKSSVVKNLEEMKTKGRLTDKCSVYHLDIAAMYPNIILTNRLQPSAIVKEQDCAMCSFNSDGANCQRRMTWTWRGDYLPASRADLQRVRSQLEKEKFDTVDKTGNTIQVAFHDLTVKEQRIIERKRYSNFCRKTYKRIHVTREEKREGTVCQRENSFYVDTVRAFRDRRYEYKQLHKHWQRRHSEALQSQDAEQIRHCHGMVVLYDSLQLAHKCILNSFYGYVMRRGARWYSMEMAGIVCQTGSSIITKARQVIEKIGLPLELDTDGIWCVLPGILPKVITMQSKTSQRVSFLFPCVALNLMLKDKYTNSQYHQLSKENLLQYHVMCENSINFEADGPYFAMILPAAREEGKKIKKRYCVFNYDKSIAELKGFEVKRNGELELIKSFQSDVFTSFLQGTSLDECYDSAGRVANYWLDILFTQGYGLAESDLLHLIAENRKMSRSLGEYTGQKSHSISTAKRLAEFLGEQVVKDKGLLCSFVIAKFPSGLPVTERAIPTAIFKSEDGVRRFYLRKWMRLSSSEHCDDIKSFIDWDYYIERLSSCIQKIITIPAAFQGVSNPVPRVCHPSWLQSKISNKLSTFKQMTLDTMFVPSKRKPLEELSEVSVAKRVCQNPSRNIVTSDKGHLEEILKVAHQLGDFPDLGKTKISFDAWADFHRKKWAIMFKLKRQLKRGIRQNIDRPSISAYSSTSTTVAQKTEFQNKSQNQFERFFQSQSSKIFKSYLQVIEITSPDPTFAQNPGEYTLFGVVDNCVVELKIKMYRTFVVNRRDTVEEKSYVRNTLRILPRSAKPFNLYEYSIPEKFFQENYRAIKVELSQPLIDGIYEMSITPLFRTIVKIGCCCTVSSNVDDITMPISVDNLSHRSVSACPYFEKDVTHFVHLYFYRSCNRYFIGVAINSDKQVHVIAVQEINDDEDESRENRVPSLVKIYKSEISKGTGSDSPFFEINNENPAFFVRTVTNADKAMKLCSNVLTEIISCSKSENRRKQVILLLNSNLTREYLRQQLSILRVVPIVTLQSHDRDDLYSSTEWQRVACRHYMFALLSSKMSYLNVLEQARYFGVPIGNLPKESLLFGIDVFFARHLQLAGHCLWTNVNGVLDIGGKQYTDSRNKSSTITENDHFLHSFSYNEADFYTSNCAQLQVKYLTVAALINSDRVNILDGVEYAVSFDKRAAESIDDMILSDQKASNNVQDDHAYYDDSSSCTNAIRILRSTVACWIKDLSAHQNQIAEMLLLSFNRWLTCSSTVLFDPLVKDSIELAKKKLFNLIIAELESLGASVIYADSSECCVINVKRHFSSVDQLQSFVLNCLINATVQRSDLLKFVFIYPSKYWQMLLWYDKGNYCGVSFESALTDCSSFKLAENSLISQHREYAIDSQFAMFYRQINKVQQLVKNIVARYVVYIYEQFCEFNKDPKNLIPLYKLQDHQNSNIAEDLLQNATKLARTQLREHVTTVAFWIRDNVKDVDSYFAPKLLGKTCRFYVQFLYCICELFSVDSIIRNEIQLLREDLLKALGHSHLSDQFCKNVITFSTASVVVNQIHCWTCSQNQDIDLYKDISFSTVLAENKCMWKCSNCQRLCDPSMIEESLLHKLNVILIQYLSQDVTCPACREVKASTFERYCACNGAPHHKIICDSAVLSAVRRIEEIASFGGFRKLQIKLDALRKCIPYIYSITKTANEYAA
ncbi:hypothetical protein GJ496_006059 [Pomphorhynchus laevis]|nr:hypothetical protein GJ496_006059 [Pomphorhynchus laevis]